MIVTKQFKVGDQVNWKWAGGVIKGQVEEVHLAPIERVIKGSKIKRNGSVEKPAYVVKSEAGNLALKLHTELFQ
jgi:ribosomal 50S subunit-recycling heat shock protein